MEESSKKRTILKILIPVLIVWAAVSVCIISSVLRNRKNVSVDLDDIAERAILTNAADLMTDFRDAYESAAIVYEGKYLIVRGYLSDNYDNADYFYLEGNAKKNGLAGLAGVSFDVKSDQVRKMLRDSKKGDLIEVTCYCRHVGQIMGYSCDAYYAEILDKGKDNPNVNSIKNPEDKELWKN